MSTRAVVAVVGGGASGTITATQLARAAHAAGRSIDLLLVEPAEPGQGIAYSTSDPRHRLNVPARGMSMWPDDPNHFLRWMQRHVDINFPEIGYAPRMHYRQYLRDCLERELQTADAVVLEHLDTRAVDIRPHGRRIRVSMADGTSRPVDAVVLAVGAGTADSSWAPAELRRSPLYASDPWTSTHKPIDGNIVLVGAGLTMLDMAQTWCREGVRVHVVSRNALMPLPHAAAPQPPVPVTEIPEGDITLAQLRHLVVEHVREVKATGGDWRQAIDGMRPVTQKLWSQLGANDRTAFLRSTARHWDQVRHRVDPAVHAWFEARREEGAILVHQGTVTEANEHAGHIDVRLSDGTVVHASAVMNCTGTYGGVHTSEDPLLMNLLGSGLVSPSSLDLGIATDADGRVRTADDYEAARPAVWAVGPLRRGDLWESTAIPEIRVQALQVAEAVVASLPDPQLRRRPRDPYGLPLSATGSAADLFSEALGRVQRVQSGAEQLVAQAVKADPDFAMGHAVLALLGVEWGCQVDVEAELQAAQRLSSKADERERRFIDVATARVLQPGAASAPALLSYISAYPEDALAVSLAVPTIAFGGATELPAESWALVEGLEPAYGSDWWYLGMLAFIRQEQERYGEADELARRALAIEPAAGHAVHAKAHVHHETGDFACGLAWLDPWIRTSGIRASHRAHFSWHAALYELSLGDEAAAAARYRSQLAPPVVDGVRALVDSASFLWRAHIADGWSVSNDMREVLDGVPADLLEDPPTPFIALHAAVGLAAVGDCQGLARLRRAATARGGEVFTLTVAPLADALVDLVHGDIDRAVDAISSLDGVARLGGSAAQQEVVEETLIHCAVKAGRIDIAERLLRERLDRRPSPRDVERLADLHPHTSS